MRPGVRSDGVAATNMGLTGRLARCWAAQDWTAAPNRHKPYTVLPGLITACVQILRPQTRRAALCGGVCAGIRVQVPGRHQPRQAPLVIPDLLRPHVI